jgi:carboxymethylenebutenolidase
MSQPNVARRTVLSAMASLPLATLLADPRLARAQAEGLETITINTREGREVTGSLARPASSDPAPAVLLIHEWWGLNDQIKTMAAALAEQGYMALAVDLYGGEIADTPENARLLMQAVEPSAALDTLTSWVEWLRGQPDTTGKIATLGWCFGGGWSLETSTATPIDATVVYYGRVNKPAEKLVHLAGPVLGHFGTEDKFINPEMVGGFEAAMNDAGKAYETHWYVANHAFANPTGGRYDEEDAQLAWARTLTFLAQHLRG